MDEAFVRLADMLEQLSAFPKDVRDQADTSRMVIDAFEIETAIELDVTRAASGEVALGSVPPLYRVDTSLRPSYHALRFRVERDEERSASEPEPLP